MSGGDAVNPSEEFEVRILACSCEGWWYENKIGTVHRVIDAGGENYDCVIQPEPDVVNLIQRCDCVIVTPLATASAELAAQGKPLVADAKSWCINCCSGFNDIHDCRCGECNTGASDIKPVSDIDTEQVTDPAHYAKSYPEGIEVYQMIEVILEKLGGHLTPYDQWLFGNILKYRLRAGFKDDGNDGMQDLKKAMRCREMMSD